MPVWAILLVFLAGISLGIVVFAAAWMIWAKPQQQQTNQPPVNKVSDLLPDTTPATTTIVSTSSDSLPPDVFNGGYETPSETGNFVIDETKADLNVRWTKIEKADPDKVFKNVKVASGTGNVTSFTKYIADTRPGDQNPDEPLYRRGTIVGGAFDGWGLYYWQRYMQTMCMGNCVNNINFIVSQDGTQAKIIGIDANMVAYYQESGLYDWDMQVALAPSLTLNIKTSTFPAKIVLQNGKTIYASENGGETRAACGTEGCAGQAPNLTVGNRFFYTYDGGCLLTYDELGVPHSYESVILPLAKDQTLGEIDGSGITWMKEYESTVKYYRPYVVGGCGFHGCAEIVDDATVGTESSLVKVGTTKSGDALYAPKDMANNDMVKKAYETWVDYSDNKSKGSMQDFLNAYKVPVFFWRDAIGRWVKYTYADGVFQGECGKPVIYLYPEQTTSVSVKLPKFIDVTVSEPTYPEQGWKTVAQPNGQLTMADGKTYGSLYWEGLGVNYQTPKDGFLIKDGEQEAFLSEILPKYGLNQTEAKEFMDFWLPEMTGAPYYRVSFLTDKWSQAAPLYVSPKPDTSIRIFMDWQKLSGPKSITAPTIVTPERKGFTLVEWGGLLYR